jgi:hypothetical protein
MLAALRVVDLLPVSSVFGVDPKAYSEIIQKNVSRLADFFLAISSGSPLAGQNTPHLIPIPPVNADN